MVYRVIRKTLFIYYIQSSLNWRLLRHRYTGTEGNNQVFREVTHQRTLFIFSDLNSLKGTLGVSLLRIGCVMEGENYEHHPLPTTPPWIMMEGKIINTSLFLYFIKSWGRVFVSFIQKFQTADFISNRKYKGYYKCFIKL